MAKSPDAFRTISEVAEWLGIQAHVLRFWESKFTQVKPVKRAGGRRYYRPGDMMLLGGIKKLLYEDGLTIKGVQKILREEGMSHVAEMSAPLDELTLSEMGDAAAVIPEAPAIHMAEPEPEPRGVVLNFENTAPAPEQKGDDAPEAAETAANTEETQDKPTTNDPEPVVSADDVQAKVDDPVAASVSEPQEPSAPSEPVAAPEEPKPSVAEENATAAELPSFLRRAMEPETDGATDAKDKTPTAEEPAAEAPPDPETSKDEPEAEPESPALPKPRQIDLPDLPPEADIAAAPALLTTVYRARRIDAQKAAEIAPLLDRLAAHRDSMAARRNGGSSPASKP